MMGSCSGRLQEIGKSVSSVLKDMAHFMGKALDLLTLGW
jgi:hypothetical protein